MASGPITSGQIDGEKVETVSDFIFLGSKINVDGECSHKIKWHLLLGRKAMTNLGSVLKKQRHHLANKVPYSQGYSFSSSHVWMREMDHKEGWRIDAFELWCWRRLLRVLWTASRSNQSILKEISPEFSSEGLVLKLWPPDVKSQLNGKDPDAGKDWGQVQKGLTEDGMVGWYYWLNGHGFEKTQGDSEGQRNLECCRSPSCRVGHDLGTEQ